MPTLITGTRTTDQVSSSLIKRNVYDAIVNYKPYQTPVLQYTLFTKGAKYPSGNPKIELQEDVFVPHTFTPTDALAGGAAGSWVLNFRSANMIKNEYPLGFRVRLHRKDVGIALETAKEMGVFLPCAALVEQIENGLMSLGYGDEDMSAMARMIRRHSGLE